MRLSKVSCAGVAPGAGSGARFNFDNLLGNQVPGVDRTDWRSLSFLMHVRI